MMKWIRGRLTAMTLLVAATLSSAVADTAGECSHRVPEMACRGPVDYGTVDRASRRQVGVLLHAYTLLAREARPRQLGESAVVLAAFSGMNVPSHAGPQLVIDLTDASVIPALAVSAGLGDAEPVSAAAAARVLRSYLDDAAPARLERGADGWEPVGEGDVRQREIAELPMEQQQALYARVRRAAVTLVTERPEPLS